MNKTRALKASLACGLLWASTIGFLAVAATAGKAPDSTALEAVVRGLIGDAACEMHDQCRTLAFGAKACDGLGHPAESSANLPLTQRPTGAMTSYRQIIIWPLPGRPGESG